MDPAIESPGVKLPSLGLARPSLLLSLLSSSMDFVFQQANAEISH
jgi:hypothetical protein